jgi:cytochrome c553
MKIHLSFAIGALALLAAAPAPAAPAATAQAQWQQECSACHIAYPPRLLSAASWNAVMDGLGSHFGTDASLDAAATQTIRAFLVQNAGRDSRSRADKPLLRITETPWFVHEHSEELPPGIFKSAAVKSASNCAACHTRAAQGSFSEHEIRLPRGAER